MKRTAKEGQIILAGYVGTVDDKTESLVSVSIANRKSKDETEWTRLSFTNPKEEDKGPKFADLARNYIEKGQYITVIANEYQKGEYTNYFVNSVELGPRNKQV